MSLANLWPTFGRTEPPTTGLWPALRTFAEDLEGRTDGQVLARIDAIRIPQAPLGKAFERRFAAPRDPSRAVSMLEIVEQADGLRFRVPGQPEVLARTEPELVAFLATFATSPRVAEMVRVLGGRPLA